jgi:urea transport system ATP-binding protein
VNATPSTLPDAAPLLRIDGIQQYYGSSHILRDVSFSARRGEVTVVLGRNGVGKTTLLKSLMGLVPIKSGRMTVDGVEMSAANPYERAKLGLGYVPQGREIFPRLTVQENLLMGLANKSAATPIPSAAAGNCPRLGVAAQGLDIGRADRRYSAQHHQRHWPGDSYVGGSG